MVDQIRAAYNRQFTPEKYQAFLKNLAEEYNEAPDFRVAETPVFVDRALKNRIIDAIEDINNIICQPNFKELTEDAIEHPSQSVPAETYHTHFLQMDFAVCRDEAGLLTPQLIEVQGFPSLYFFQEQLALGYRQHFNIPTNFHHLFDGLNTKQYIELLRRLIVGDLNPENVVLLEIEPHKQITRIDFWGAQQHLGIKVLCVSELKKDGKNVYYVGESGRKIPVHRIYNRVIFDELIQRDDLKREFYFTEENNVEWVGHPNWFFRISKFTMPLIKSQYVPDTYFLHHLETYPADLENYVLKPLYSFAGSGVKYNVTRKDLEEINKPQNYILQKKVQYEPVVQAPDSLVKCELRMLMLWQNGEPKAQLVNNLARLSKGEMIGVRYNKDKDWVGASVGFFEEG